MTHYDEDYVRSLAPGTEIRDPTTGETLTLARHTDPDDGWWLSDGSWLRWSHVGDYLRAAALRTEMFQRGIAAVYRCGCGAEFYAQKDLGYNAAHACNEPFSPFEMLMEGEVPTPEGMAGWRIAERVWP